jgi:hypothetical protein
MRTTREAYVRLFLMAVIVTALVTTLAACGGGRMS